jgi:ACS family sodium-dependent inorganic phosphate cotransporter
MHMAGMAALQHALVNRPLEVAGACHAGVVGVALTGLMLDAAGVESIGGWWQAFATASALCVAGSLYFLSAARGERLFGDGDQF